MEIFDFGSTTRSRSFGISLETIKRSQNTVDFSQLEYSFGHVIAAYALSGPHNCNKTAIMQVGGSGLC